MITPTRDQQVLVIAECGSRNADLNSIRNPQSKIRNRPRRRGIIFVAALGIIVVLTALVLVFSQSMRTESLASSNRVSMLQADAVEQGAERWVLANVEENGSDAVTITQIPANALQLQGGYFWCLAPDGDSDQTYQYGIVDEAGKLNINSANATQLAALPNMTDDIGASIVAWRGITPGMSLSAITSSVGSPATSSYYQTLPEPYSVKNSPFESLEELMLIKDMTTQIMYGYDVNHDNVISAAEQQAGGMSASMNGVTNGSRGIANDLTCWTVQTSGRTSVSNSTRLQTLLQKYLSASRVTTVLSNLQSYSRTGQFSSLSDFYTASGMTQDEFKQLAGQITANTGTTFTGLVNANTASLEVLEALLTSNGSSSVSSSDANSLITARGGSIATTSSSGISWVVDALGVTKAAAILDQLTSQSYQYSADIVAVSPDGRAFKRVKIIVDNRNSPAKIVFART